MFSLLVSAEAYSRDMSEPLVVGEYPTPWVTIWAVVTPEDGVIRSSSMNSREAALSALTEDLAQRGVVSGSWPAVADAVAAWVSGDPDALVRVPARQPGGPFFQQVWEAMRRVPAGEPVSYAELAAMAGRPKAVRAAGTACATNTLAPFVPCHRVVRSGGSLGNYGYGTDLKRTLLEHEAAS